MMHQLTIFDELDRQDHETPRAAYKDRYRRQDLVPGEPCPACGRRFTLSWDPSGDHFPMEDDACTGMTLARRHLWYAIREDGDLSDERARAIRAGWPAAIVDQWIADPTLLEAVEG